MIHIKIKDNLTQSSTIDALSSMTGESSYHMTFTMMLFWLVLLGQGTFNALIMLAIKHYHLREDIGTWKSSVYFNFAFCAIIYVISAMCYFTCLKAGSYFLRSQAFVLSFFLYLIGQVYCIYYCVQRAKRLDD